MELASPKGSLLTDINVLFKFLTTCAVGELIDFALLFPSATVAYFSLSIAAQHKIYLKGTSGDWKKLPVSCIGIGNNQMSCVLQLSHQHIAFVSCLLMPF